MRPRLQPTNIRNVRASEASTHVHSRVNTGQHAHIRVIIRAFRASLSTSCVFAGLLRIAQYTGVCPSMSAIVHRTHVRGFNACAF